MALKQKKKKSEKERSQKEPLQQGGKPDDFKCEIVDESLDSEKLGDILTKWGLKHPNTPIMYVFAGYSSTLLEWEQLCKLSDRLKSKQVDVTFFIFCPLYWLRYNDCKNMSAKCVTFPLTNPFSYLAVDKLKETTMEERRTVLSDMYDCNIFSHFIVCSGNVKPVVPDFVLKKPIALLLDTDSIDTFEKWFDTSSKTMPFYKCFLSYECSLQKRADSVYEFVQLVSELGDALFVEMVKHYDVDNHETNVSSPGSAVTTGTLYSDEKLNYLNLRFCKCYQIVESLDDVTLSGLVFDFKTQKNKNIYQLFVIIPECSTHQNRKKVGLVFELIESILTTFHNESENVQVMIYDSKGWLFMNDAKHPIISTGDIERHTHIRCVALVPLGAVKEKIRTDSLKDNNTFVDSYIIFSDSCMTYRDNIYESFMSTWNAHVQGYLTLRQAHISLRGLDESDEKLSVAIGKNRNCEEYLFEDYSGSGCFSLVYNMLYLLMTNRMYMYSDILSTSCKDVCKHLCTNVDHSPLILKLCICVILEATFEIDEKGRNLLGVTLCSLLQLYTRNKAPIMQDTAKSIKTKTKLERLVIRLLLHNKQCYDLESCVLESKEEQCESYKRRLDYPKHSDIKGVFSDYFLTNPLKEEKKQGHDRKKEGREQIKVEKEGRKAKNFHSSKKIELTWSPLNRDDFSTVDHHFPSLAFLAAVHGGLPLVAESMLEATLPREFIANAMYAVGVFRNENNLSEALTRKLGESADRIEILASAIIHDVHMENRNWSSQIIFDDIERYNCNTFDLAYKANARTFLSSEACANSIHETWWGKKTSEKQANKDSSLDISRKKFAVFHTCKTNCNNETVPAVKSIIHFIFYFAFALFYSYLLLTGMRAKFNPISEPILIFWMFTISLDEIIQIYHFKCVSRGNGRFEKFNEKMKLYFSDFWNKWDLLLIILFSAGYILRISALLNFNSKCHLASRVFFAVDITFVYIRLLQFFAINDKIGPLLITTGAMITDLLYFALIMLAFMTGYAVALSHILQEMPSFKYLFFIPYYQIYGELGLDEIMGTNDWFNATNSNYSSLTEIDDIIVAGPENYIAIGFTSLYVLMANILLLNLLIAKFSSTYAEIASNSALYHVKHKITILREYERKSIFPPPFNTLVFFYKIIFVHTCKGHCQNRVKPDKSPTNDICLSRSSQFTSMVLENISTKERQFYNTLENTFPEWWKHNNGDQQKALDFIQKNKVPCNLLSLVQSILDSARLPAQVAQLVPLDRKLYHIVIFFLDRHHYRNISQLNKYVRRNLASMISSEGGSDSLFSILGFATDDLKYVIVEKGEQDVANGSEEGESRNTSYHCSDKDSTGENEMKEGEENHNTESSIQAVYTGNLDKEERRGDEISIDDDIPNVNQMVEDVENKDNDNNLMANDDDDNDEGQQKEDDDNNEGLEREDDDNDEGLEREDDDNNEGLEGEDDDNNEGLEGEDDDNDEGLKGEDDDNDEGLEGEDDDNDEGLEGEDDGSDEDSDEEDDDSNADSDERDSNIEVDMDSDENNSNQDDEDDEDFFNDAIQRAIEKHMERHDDITLKMILDRLKSLENKNDPNS